ncbi:hypothetical protein J6590_096967 [Homalodisca vitripennis]|nr:hypothetical protein J6590_096967 [Homalodisca vitripennis]
MRTIRSSSRSCFSQGLILSTVLTPVGEVEAALLSMERFRKILVTSKDKREDVPSTFLELFKTSGRVNRDTLVQEESCGIRGLPHRCLLSYLKDINKSVQIAHVMKNKVNMPYGIRRNLSSGQFCF